MIVIDASVWVSAVLPHDRFHSRSQSFIEQLLDGDVVQVVPTIFLPEVVGAVARQTTAEDGAGVRSRLMTINLLQWVTVDPDLAAASAQLGAALLLRGADSIYVAVAERLGVPLISWDGEHITRAAQAITVYTPDTVPHP